MNTKYNFLINKSELKDRWDPYFYKPEYHNFRNFLKSIGCLSLKNYIDSWNRGDGPRDGYYSESLDDDRVPFIRVNNLKNHTIDKTNIKFIHRNIHNTKLKRTQVTSGDLIFAISGTKDNLGTLAIVPEDIKEANLNSALVRLDLSESLDKFFLCILFELNFVRKQIDIIGKGAAQNNLNNKEIGSIQIPQLSLKEQKRVIEIYNFAFDNFGNINRKVKEKLASIDIYLLDKLGLSKLDFSAIKLESCNIFIEQALNISGKRQDPDYYHIKYKKLLELIHRSTFSLLSLNECCLMIKSGKTPASKDYSTNISEFPVIKVGSYSGDFIDLKKQTYAINEQPYEVSKGDIFILSAAHQAEYVGRHIKYLNEIPEKATSFVGELICIRANEKTIKSELLFSFLNLDIFKTLINREKRGQTSHIYPQDIKNICIPIPPMDIQDEIVEYVQQIRAEVKKLEEEANLVLENAKQEIEKMILGETE